MSCRRQTALSAHTHRSTASDAHRLGTHRHQVLDHIHVRQRVDLGHPAGVTVDLVQTRQRVSTADIHRTRPADSCRQNRLRAQTTAEPVHSEPGLDSPSLQERLKVSVPSISFLILMSASRTIGPQLKHRRRSSERIYKDGARSERTDGWTHVFRSSSYVCMRGLSPARSGSQR